MSDTTHTPGPWTAHGTVVAAHGRVIAVTDAAGYDETDTDVFSRFNNARLIAAAPELMAALAGLLMAVEHGKVPGISHWKIPARAALAKAEGPR